MKNFLTSVIAVLIAIAGTMMVFGARPADFLRMGSTLLHRIASIGAPSNSSDSSNTSDTPAPTPPSFMSPVSQQATPALAAATPLPQSAQATPPPLTLAALSQPRGLAESVALKQEMEFPAMLNGQTVGSVQLIPGVMVDIVAVEDGGMLRVQYQGAPKEIPAAATDVLERAENGIVAKAAAIARGQEASSQFNLKFIAADGSSVDISRLRGHVVLVDFWATWCGPCMQEVPNVVATYRKYHAQGFDIIGISLDQDRAAMLSTMQAQGMTWPQYFDGRAWDNNMATTFNIHSIPAMWLINKKGVLVTTEGRDNLEAQVAKLLAE